ncbi:hypothetical protein B0H10DRAFT_2199631, partial [Mycena sp. CBHHK59/15]
ISIFRLSQGIQGLAGAVGVFLQAFRATSISHNLEPATTPQPQALPSPVHSAGVLHKRIDIEVSQGSSQYACKLVQEVITQ